ncbi:hypothetical protein XH96_30160 [Bradyrhizobium sp. CCBAU 51765]|nr:hypothetical protein XH96_30160 [Bradyrhizobium sp. CCBAU 51765]
MSSLPPEDDVPLPLGFDRLAVPVVGVSTRGLAELAAGSPVTAPRPLGAPPCARADPAANTVMATTANPAFISVLPVSLCGLTLGLGAPFRSRARDEQSVGGHQGIPSEHGTNSADHC